MVFGNVSKNSQYLNDMNARVRLKPWHPKHQGIKMQAHHLISAEGVKLSKLGAKLEEFGYDINNFRNLAFLPSTLQGACHLGVQPHRGDHTVPCKPLQAEDHETYDDDKHPPSYHTVVQRRIQGLKLPFNKACEGKDDPAHKTVVSEMNRQSALLLSQICKDPESLRLTDVAQHFAPGNPIGCGGLDSVPELRERAHKCPTNRNHLKRQGPGQRSEDISYMHQEAYKIEPGV